MSSLNEQLNSFKNKVRNAPVLGKRVAEPRADEAKRPRPAPQPVPSLAHAGTHFVHAIKYLKQQERAVPLKELEDYLSVPVAPLMPLLQNHSSIRLDYDAKTATYVSIYDIYSGEELLRHLSKQTAFQPLEVKLLKDGWSGALQVINRLEAEQKLLVLRNKKDNSPRLVWINSGGPLGYVDKDFVDMWASARVPSANDLPGALETYGLVPSSMDPSQVKVQQPKPGAQKKRKKTYRSRITNTHLQGVLKDYNH